MTIDNAIMIAIITALTNIALYVLKWYSEKRKDTAGVFAVDADTIKKYNETIDQLRGELGKVDRDLDTVRDEARAAKITAEEQIADLVKKKDQQLADLTADYERQINALRAELTARIQALEAENYRLIKENNQLKQRIGGIENE